jgi:hypothetical protein
MTTPIVSALNPQKTEEHIKAKPPYLVFGAGENRGLRPLFPGFLFLILITPDRF